MQLLGANFDIVKTAAVSSALRMNSFNATLHLNKTGHASFVSEMHWNLISPSVLLYLKRFGVLALLFSLQGIDGLDKGNDEDYSVTTPVVCDCATGCSEHRGNDSLPEVQFRKYYHQEKHCTSVRGSLPHLLISDGGKGVSGHQCAARHDIYEHLPIYYIPYKTYFRNQFYFFGKRYGRNIFVKDLIYWSVQITARCFQQHLPFVVRKSFTHLLELVLAANDTCQLIFLPPREYADLKTCFRLPGNRCTSYTTDMCHSFISIPKAERPKASNYNTVCKVCSWLLNDSTICEKVDDAYVVLSQPAQYSLTGMTNAELRCLRLVS